jgi:hypothetical protein
MRLELRAVMNRWRCGGGAAWVAAGAVGDAEGAAGRGGGGDERVRFRGSGGWIRWPRGGAVA